VFAVDVVVEACYHGQVVHMFMIRPLAADSSIYLAAAPDTLIENVGREAKYDLIPAVLSNLLQL
jgi:hypothetical protein